MCGVTVTLDRLAAIVPLLHALTAELRFVLIVVHGAVDNLSVKHAVIIM